MYFEDINGKYMFDITKIKDANKWCQGQVKHALVCKQYPVVVSNTFVQKWELTPYITMCEEIGCEYIIIRLNNNYGSIHNVSIEEVEKMKEAMVDIDGEITIK